MGDMIIQLIMSFVGVISTLVAIHQWTVLNE
jgi:hypothetical protein